MNIVKIHVQEPPHSCLWAVVTQLQDYLWTSEVNKLTWDHGPNQMTNSACWKTHAVQVSPSANVLAIEENYMLNFSSSFSFSLADYCYLDFCLIHQTVDSISDCCLAELTASSSSCASLQWCWRQPSLLREQVALICLLWKTEQLWLMGWNQEAEMMAIQTSYDVEVHVADEMDWNYA